MKLTALHELWYENEHGQKFVPPPGASLDEAPDGFYYQHYMPACVLRQTVIDTRQPHAPIAKMTTTWSEDIVLAMARPTDKQRIRAFQRTKFLSKPYSLKQAILIVTHACERCTNVLVWNHGVTENDGYPELGPAWQLAGTVCTFCAHLDHGKVGSP